MKAWYKRFSIFTIVLSKNKRFQCDQTQPYFISVKFVFDTALYQQFYGLKYLIWALAHKLKLARTSANKSFKLNQLFQDLSNIFFSALNLHDSCTELAYSTVHATICCIWTGLGVNVLGTESPKYTRPKESLIQNKSSSY